MIVRYLRVLLFGGLFIFSFSVFSKTLIQEVFVYKVASSISSLTDLKTMTKNLINLKCIYPDSFLTSLFEQASSKRILNLSASKIEMKKLDPQTKKLFEHFLSLSKLVAYTQSHNIYVDKNLVSAFYKLSKKCNRKEMFNRDKVFFKEFEQIMATEIFLRKRFLSHSNKKRLGQKQRKELIKNIKLLIKTINKQIDSEVFWTK